MSNGEATARELFEKLDADRSGVLSRQRDVAKLTIPHLLPPEGHTESSKLTDPYQSLGARGVNNLASKIMLALLPPGQKFFMLQPDESVVRELTEKMGIAQSAIKESLSMDENIILKEIDRTNIRSTAFEAMRHLVALGNALLYLPEKGGMKMYRLDQYVVRRDREGNTLDIVVKESLSPTAMTPEMRQQVSVTDEQNENDAVEVYTHIRRKKNQWVTSQEINDKKVPNSRATHPLTKPAWFPLRWTNVPGENYGRGLGEEHLGDLRSYEGLQKSTLQLAANSAKLVWLIAPNGAVKVKHFNEAENGEAISGRQDDISAVQPEKFHDLRGAMEQASVVEARLQQAFLLTSSIQRDAERVTATEIQTMAQELEDALGGVYSVLAQEFQRPLVMRLLKILQKRGEIRQYPEDTIEPNITTGIEALGRGGELKKLKAFAQDLAELGAEQALQRLNIDDFLTRLAAARGIDTQGLVKSQEQMGQEQQQQMIQQLIQDAGPDAVKAMIDNMAQQQPGG